MTGSASSGPTQWDRDDLAQRLCAALELARRAVVRLGTDGYADAEEPANDVRPEKVISETGLLLLAASRVSHAQVRASVDDVARALVPRARSERMVLGLCLEPALAWDYAQAHVFLTRLGFPDREFDELLRRSAGAQARDGRERVPYRVLEREWLRAGWRTGPGAAVPAGVPAGSVLAAPMDLFGGSREDVYAFAHSLMYLTDLGIRECPLPRHPGEVLAEAEAAVARCLDEQDYDLGGEVLMAWPLTRAPWTAAATFGFRVLARVEDEAGLLPAPGTRLERLQALEADERTDYLLATGYHTAYVMGLLCAFSLQPGPAPPVAIPPAGGERGAADELLAFLDIGEREPHWRAEFRRLDAVERDALAGLVFAVAVRRHIGRRDFGAVRRVLEICHRRGLSDSPAASQTAELLERLALLAETVARGRSEIETQGS